VRAALVVAVAAVWVVNGAWCKVLGQVPRHAQIVARVVGDDLAPSLTIAIGLAELLMAVWWCSGRFRVLCAVSQTAVVLTMNLIEQAIAPDLLLWGRFNLLWASLFCVVVVAVGIPAPRAEPPATSEPR
jgi:hypothetical protein